MVLKRRLWSGKLKAVLGLKGMQNYRKGFKENLGLKKLKVDLKVSQNTG